MQTMKEIEFADLIDCKFPYTDKEKAKMLIHLANSISPNAMFMVLEELCRPPTGKSVSHEALSELMVIWNGVMNHPLAKPTLQVARQAANNVELPMENALRLAEEIAPFRGQYAALNIAYFCCDDSDGVVEQACSRICEDWESV